MTAKYRPVSREIVYHGVYGIIPRIEGFVASDISCNHVLMYPIRNAEDMVKLIRDHGHAAWTEADEHGFTVIITTATTLEVGHWVSRALWLRPIP